MSVPSWKSRLVDKGADPSDPPRKLELAPAERSAARHFCEYAYVLARPAAGALALLTRAS